MNSSAKFVRVERNGFQASRAAGLYVIGDDRLICRLKVGPGPGVTGVFSSMLQSSQSNGHVNK